MWCCGFVHNGVVLCLLVCVRVSTGKELGKVALPVRRVAAAPVVTTAGLSAVNVLGAVIFLALLCFELYMSKTVVFGANRLFLCSVAGPKTREKTCGWVPRLPWVSASSLSCPNVWGRTGPPSVLWATLSLRCREPTSFPLLPFMMFRSLVHPFHRVCCVVLQVLGGIPGALVAVGICASKKRGQD